MRVSSVTKFLVLLAATLSCGCESERPPAEVPLPYADPEPAARKGAAGSKDAIATGPFVKRFEGISFQVPEGWQEVKPAGSLIGFVDARFVIPADEGPVELTCLLSGGGIDENTTRWVGQFDTLPDGRKTEIIDVDRVRATWVDLRGTFNGNASGTAGPHPGWRMLGAGIPVKDRACFLKLNGPDAAVARIHDEFRDFVKRARLD